MNLWCYGPDAVGQDFGGFVPFQGRIEPVKSLKHVTDVLHTRNQHCSLVQHRQRLCLVNRCGHLFARYDQARRRCDRVQRSTWHRCKYRLYTLVDSNPNADPFLGQICFQYSQDLQATRYGALRYPRRQFARKFKLFQ